MTNRTSGVVSKLVLGLALGAAVVVASPAAAQSTIFNIPSTDTVAAKKGYFEFDYLVQLPAPDAGQFQIFVPRIVVGVAPNLEVGLNLANTKYQRWWRDLLADSAEPQVQVLCGRRHAVAASAGVIFYAPLNHRDDIRRFGLIYGNVQQEDLWRLWAAPHGWHLRHDVVCATTPRAPCSATNSRRRRGEHRRGLVQRQELLGLLHAGISIVLPRSGLLNIGYSIGNDSYDGNKNRALFIYYGITFP